MGVGEGGGHTTNSKVLGTLAPDGSAGSIGSRCGTVGSRRRTPPSRMHPYTPIDESSAGSGVGWCRGEFSDTD